MYLWPDLGRFVWIWAIILGFGPFCLHLGHIAWIWAIWHNLGQNRPQRRRSPEDEAGGDGWTHRRSYRQIRLAFYKTLSPLGPPPKKERKRKKKTNSKRSLKDRKELKKKERNLKEKKIGSFFFTVLLFYVLSIRPQQSSFSQIVPPIVNKSAVHF